MYGEAFGKTLEMDGIRLSNYMMDDFGRISREYFVYDIVHGCELDVATIQIERSGNQLTFKGPMCIEGLSSAEKRSLIELGLAFERAVINQERLRITLESIIYIRDGYWDLLLKRENRTPDIQR